MLKKQNKQNYQNSHISIKFNEFQQNNENTSKISFQFILSFDETKTNSKLNQLQAETNNLLGDLDQCILLTSDVAFQKSGPLAKIAESCNISEKENNGKFYLKIQHKNESFLGPFNVLLEMGLKEISKEQKNKIKGKLEIKLDTQKNEENQSLNLHESNFQVVLGLKLHENAGQFISSVCKEIDEEFANSPPLLFLKHFKFLDIDIQLDSSEIQEYWQNIQSSESLKLLNLFNQLLNLIDIEQNNYQVLYFIQDFALFSGKFEKMI